MSLLHECYQTVEEKRDPLATKKEILNRVLDLLEHAELKKTSLRTELLQLLIESKTPKSQVEIIQALSKKMTSVDRVTIYRNLKQLKDKGLVHEVDVNQYIFCEHDCDQHAHLLLFCTQCQKHEEIRDHKKINVFMKGLKEFSFFSSENPISLRGTCLSCQSQI